MSDTVFYFLISVK